MQGKLLKKYLVAALVIIGALLLYGHYSRMHREGERIDRDLQRIREHMREHSRADHGRPEVTGPEAVRNSAAEPE